MTMSTPPGVHAPIRRRPSYQQTYRTRVAGPVDRVWQLFEVRCRALQDRKDFTRNADGKVVWTFELPASEGRPDPRVRYREDASSLDASARTANFTLCAEGDDPQGEAQNAARLEMSAEMIDLGPKGTAVQWTFQGALFDHTLVGSMTRTFDNLRSFADAAYPPRFDFEEHVFPAELDVIRQRADREARSPGDEDALRNRRHQSSVLARQHGRYDPRDEAVAAERPSVAHNLVGLSLSGGGVRSSTFNLGVLQGLHQAGVLRHVDYLSTVSGGGYIGSAWSALCSRGDGFPFECAPTGEDAPGVAHARKNSNYLVTRGLGDWTRMVMAVLRGVFLNFLLAVPFLLLLATLTEVVAGDAMRHAVNPSSVGPVWHPPTSPAVGGGVRGLFATLGAFWLTRRVAVAYLLWIVLSGPITKMGQRVMTTRYRDALSSALRRVLAWTRVQPDVAAPADLQRVEDWYVARDLYERSFAVGLVALVGVAFVEALPFTVSALYLARLGATHDLPAGIGLGTALSAAGGMLSRLNSSVGQRLALVGAAVLGPTIVFWLYFVVAKTIVFEPWARRPDPAWPLVWVGLATAMLLYARLWIDVNLHSGHGFWRDRLSRAFLVAPRRGGLDHVDGLLLSQMNPTRVVDADPEAPRGRMPYHLLNVTLNLAGDRPLTNAGRCGDFFVFSPCFVGGPRTGYVPTDAMERFDPHLNLGTAMAISSAAAAPNMGAYTLPSVRFLMSLFNVRMGRWVPHPDRVRQVLGLTPAAWRLTYDAAQREVQRWTRLRIALWHATPRYLLREMTGSLDDQQDLVNVSDGGHLENLGAYELLRRRCRFVIVGDGEADPGMQFHALAALVLYARLDLGIEITIALDDVGRGEKRAGHRHCAIGTIRYPARDGLAEGVGTLVYLKSSLTGDEDHLIAHYHAAWPDFPHETTADQFFSEEQFEAYRSLGLHIATESFRRDDDPRDPSAGAARALSFTDFEALVQRLAATPAASAAP